MLVIKLVRLVSLLSQAGFIRRFASYLSYCLSMVSLLGAITPKAIALPAAKNLIAAETIVLEDRSESPHLTQATGTSADLSIDPFFNLYHVEAGGYLGFTGVEAFYPLFQTPGQNLTFLTGRLNVNNAGNFGAGLQGGYRALLGRNTIGGAYGGLDIRDTDDNTFTQAGFGAELLGKTWDVHLSTNIPLGNSSQMVASGTQIGNTRFAGNQLLVDVQSLEEIEAALTTVSLDGGLQLFDFGEGSTLWGRGGVYYLGGQASSDSLGFRVSLDQRLKNNVRLGVGLQHDDLFDTNIIFSVNALLGGGRQRSLAAEDSAPAQLWARAGEPLARTNTIVVETQTDSETQFGVATLNPETERDYTFRHVSPNTGSAGAAGTFEDPRDTVANTVAITTPNADNIIYVQAGGAGGGFTIPDGVQIRSVGPAQQLNTQFGIVTLPGSGSGRLPTINDTVVMGNDSLLSGFAIDPAGADAILANGVRNIFTEDNTIENANRGIYLPDIDGTVTIVRNQILNTADDGIYFDSIDGTDNAAITIVDNTLADIGEAGIAIDYIGGDATANITISSNQISNAEEGIYFDTIAGNTNATVTIASNQIFDVVDEGIQFDDIEENAIATITIASNTISGARSGTYIDFIEDNANATITITDNQISDVSDAGLYFFDIEDNTVVNIAIRGNTITNAGEEGIQFDDIEDSATANVIIANNTISGATSGTYIDSIEDSANATITITDNQISDVSDAGLYFFSIEDDAIAQIIIQGNTIANAGEEGIQFYDIYGNAVANITIQGNTITNTGEEGIQFDDIYDSATANITIQGNTITNAGTQGIRFDDIYDNATANITIQDNTIMGSGEEGAYFEDIQDDANVTITIANNQISDTGGDGVGIGALEDNSTVTATISNNTITAPGDDGVTINHTAATDFCLALNNNTVTTPISDGFQFDSTGAGQFQIVDLASVTANNTGTFNPIDIVTNGAFVSGTVGVAPCP